LWNFVTAEVFSAFDQLGNEILENLSIIGK